ncbi:MAG: lamin tail domain-containing protein, partial [Chitinophagaceae bacterium]
MRARFILALIFFASLSVNAQVISQVYGGGGNVGATYTNDFIEIFNNTQTAINLTGYSVQYSPANSTAPTTNTFVLVAALSGIIQPGQYYLIQANSSGPVGNALPTPDATGNTNLGAQDGKVILVSTITPVPTTGIVLDFVGYGGANCAEGIAETGVGSTTTNGGTNAKSIV